MSTTEIIDPRFPHPPKQLNQKSRSDNLWPLLAMSMVTGDDRHAYGTAAHARSCSAYDRAAHATLQVCTYRVCHRPFVIVAVPERMEGDNLLGDGRDERHVDIQAREEADDVLRLLPLEAARRGPRGAAHRCGRACRAYEAVWLGLCLLFDVATSFVMNCAGHVDCGDGNEVWRIDETEVGAVGVIDEEPVQCLNE